MNDSIVNCENTKYFRNLVIVNECNPKMHSYDADSVDRIACLSHSSVDHQNLYLVDLITIQYTNETSTNLFNAWLKIDQKLLIVVKGVSKSSITKPYFYPYDGMAYKIDYILRKFNIPIIIAIYYRYR